MPKDALTIGADGIAQCPFCSGELFELYDAELAKDDASTFRLRKSGEGFERKSDHGGMTYDTMWRQEQRRVLCVVCRSSHNRYVGFDLANGGTVIEP